MIKTLADFPTYGYILIIVAVLILAVVLILFLIPSFRPKNNTESPEEIAKKEADSWIVNISEKEMLEIKIRDIESDRRFIEKKEKDLGFIFTDIDVEALLVQVEQDRIDAER
ncbi:MAG: hypothetical protein WCR67_05240 [Bacilli bacterium]